MNSQKRNTEINIVNTEFQHSLSSCTINIFSVSFVIHAELILNTPPRKRLFK